MREIKQIFAQRLKELRKARGLTQDEFSKEIDVSRQSITLYEKGLRVPDIEVAHRITRYCGITSDYLIGLSDDPDGYVMPEEKSDKTIIARVMNLRGGGILLCTVSEHLGDGEIVEYSSGDDVFVGRVVGPTTEAQAETLEFIADALELKYPFPKVLARYVRQGLTHKSFSNQTMPDSE